MKNHASSLDRKIEPDEVDAQTQPLNELAEHLRTDLITGLSRNEAEERLQFVGPNLVPKVKSSFYRTYIAPMSLEARLKKLFREFREANSYGIISDTNCRLLS